MTERLAICHNTWIVFVSHSDSDRARCCGRVFVNSLRFAPSTTLSHSPFANAKMEALDPDGHVRIRLWLVQGSEVKDSCRDAFMNPDDTVQDFLHTLSTRYRIQEYDIDIWKVRCISLGLWQSV